MYYGNFQTTTRGPVRVTAQIQLNGASAPTLVAGHGVALAHTGGSNDCTVTFPEKFGKCTWLSSEYFPPNGHNAAFSSPTANYSPTTGKATFTIAFSNGTLVTSLAPDIDPTGVLYVEAEFELGM